MAKTTTFIELWSNGEASIAGPDGLYLIYKVDGTAIDYSESEESQSTQQVFPSQEDFLAGAKATYDLGQVSTRTHAD